MTTYGRAHDYALAGHVGPVMRQGEKYVAVVEGSETYTTSVHPDTGRGNCTCPADKPCKHMGALAAVVLRMADGHGQPATVLPTGKQGKPTGCDLAIRVHDQRYVAFGVVLPQGEVISLNRGNLASLKASLQGGVRFLNGQYVEYVIHLSEFMSNFFPRLVRLEGVHFFIGENKSASRYAGEIPLQVAYDEVVHHDANKHISEHGYRAFGFRRRYFIKNPETQEIIQDVYSPGYATLHLTQDKSHFYAITADNAVKNASYDLTLAQLERRTDLELYKKWRHSFETAVGTGPKLMLSVMGIENETTGKLTIEGRLEIAYAKSESYLTSREGGSEVAEGARPVYCISVFDAVRASSQRKEIVQHKTGVFIRRDRKKEIALIAPIYYLHHTKSGRVRIAKADYAEFFATTIPKAKADGVLVRINDNILGILSRPMATLNVKGSSGIDWFEGKIEVEGIATEHLGEIILAVRRKDELVKLKNGNWLSVQGSGLADVLKSLERLGIKAQADGSIDKISCAQLASLEAEKQALLRTEAGAKVASEKIRSLISASPPTDKPGKDFKAKLRPYQLAGMRYILHLQRSRVGGILADDMGLGKTVQAIAAMSCLTTPALRATPPCKGGELLAKSSPPAKGEHGEAGRGSSDEARFLVVCPVAALGVWEDEIRKFAPRLTAYRWHGPERNERDAKKAQIILTTFATFSLDAEKLTRKRWSIAFIDEAQFVKNFRSRSARELRKIQADSIVCLTGTPLENYLEDLWALFDLFFPGYLGSAQRFKEAYGGHLEVKDAEGLQRKIRPFLLRRRKADVLKELPEKSETVVKIPMTSEQARVYEAARMRALEFLKQKGSPLFDMLKQLTALRRIACHPFLEAENPDPLHSGKFEYLESKLVELSVSSEGILIFSQYTSVLKVLLQMMMKRGIEPLYLDGKTSEKARRALVARFQDGGAKFFLISLKAGGTALTLTQADTVIHLDPWWNPAVESQATDRAHRIGQKKRVMVYKLVSEGTVEEKVLTLQGHKRALFDEVVDSRASKTKKISRDDIAALLDSK